MERCGFFDANLVGEEYDRVYLSAQFAAYFASFIGNGVYASKSDKLQVVEQDLQRMAVNVLGGQGWISGYWYENTESISLAIDVADGVLSRIDSVVLRLGFSERNMWVAIKKGTPAISPSAPVLTRNADYYELQLATIDVPASSIKITQAQITDTRMNQNVCGWVTGVVDQLDTTTLFNQFNSYYDQFKTTNKSDFDTWFQSVKDQLSTDAAGHLQTEIDTLSANISAVDTDLTNKNAVTSFAIAVATWSAATTTIDGTAYYTYVVSLTAVNTDVPDVMIGAVDTLPTADEQAAFNCIKYAVVDDVAKTLTLYAEILPASLFYVKVRGVV